MKPKKMISWSNKGDLIIDQFKITESFKKKRFTGQSLIEEEIPVALIKNKSGKDTDFLVGQNVLLVISSRAKLFFEENVKNSKVEYLPVKMENYSKKETYWVLNILDIVKCFDWEKSEYSLFDEPAPNGEKVIDEVYTMIFKPKEIGNKEIFYSYEFPVEVFISPEFEKKLLNSNLSGYKILEVNSYP